MVTCVNQSRPVEACRPFCFSQKKKLTKQQGQGGAWTQWSILTIDIRPPAPNGAVEFAKLPSPS